MNRRVDTTAIAIENFATVIIIFIIAIIVGICFLLFFVFFIFSNRVTLVESKLTV